MSTSSATLLVFVSDKLACIKIVGRANFNSSMDFKTLVNELLEKKFNCLVLDLAECMLMDSTFLGVLAGYGLQMRNGQSNGIGRNPIELMNPNPRIADLLDNLGVLHLFHVVNGPLPELSRATAAPAPVPAVTATRAEVVSTCLEAHKLLMALDPANVPKFKEVALFLAEDLKKLKADADCGCK
jgi:anti-anti-sigma factor